MVIINFLRICPPTTSRRPKAAELLWYQEPLVFVFMATIATPNPALWFHFKFRLRAMIAGVCLEQPISIQRQGDYSLTALQWKPEKPMPKKPARAFPPTG